MELELGVGLPLLHPRPEGVGWLEGLRRLVTETLPLKTVYCLTPLGVSFLNH